LTVPTFCRHNRLLQNCPICSREQHVEMRPVISSGTPRSAPPGSGAPASERKAAARSGSRPGVRVRRLERAPDDGYRSVLVPGLRASGDAERLAEEIGFADWRLKRLADDPVGLYAEVADGGDVEERTWLAFLIAYLCPVDGEDPFAAVRAIRTTWASGQLPELDDVHTGPRSAHDPPRGYQTIEAYRAWAARAGSQAQAFTGETSWSPERRFARAFERLSLPGLHRDARFDLLVTLGQLGVFELHAGQLALGTSDQVTAAAKRIFGIGDILLLERRAAALAEACSVPLEALDLGFYNWERGERATLGLGLDAEPGAEAAASARAALGV
jgi:hypothetical protein